MIKKQDCIEGRKRGYSRIDTIGNMYGSSEWIKEYDIKREMFSLIGARRKGNEYKISKFLLSCEFSDDLEFLDQMDSENLDKEIYYKRYFLFKLQAKERCKFDCDHLMDVFGEYRLVDQFFERYFNYCENLPKDTCFSVQWLWGKVLGQADDVEIRKKYNDFEWQYKNLTIVRKFIGEELYDAFGNLMHYYHTIGNIYPCPKGFNVGKFCGGKYYDRLDLYVKSDEGRKNSEWLSAGEMEKYKINEFFCDKLLSEDEISKLIIEKKFIELAKYIGLIVSLIKNRSDKLMNCIKGL